MMTDLRQYNIRNQPILSNDEMTEELAILERDLNTQRKAVDRLRQRVYDLEQDTITLKAIVHDTISNKSNSPQPKYELFCNQPPDKIPRDVWIALEKLCRQYRR